MNFKSLISCIVLAFSLSPLSHATPQKVQLLVWAQEAITATYTYHYKSYNEDQKAIAGYFSADAWVAYSKALYASKLPEAIQKNAYDVSAVATQPPKLISSDATHWVVSMPILVVYKNPQYQQQQNLKVIIEFSQAAQGQGVRGFSVSSFKASSISPPCQCSVENSNDYNP